MLIFLKKFFQPWFQENQPKRRIVSNTLNGRVYKFNFAPKELIKKDPLKVNLN